MESKFAKTFNEKVESNISMAKDREQLFSVLHSFQEKHNMKKLISELREIINEPKRMALYEHIRPLIPIQHQIEYDRLVPKRNSEKMRVIRLNRDNSENLGFSIRGGLEHAVGLYVSEVERGSLAYKQGLRVGDEIIRLNGFTISQAIHQEALNLIKARPEIVLKVRNVGMIPVKNKPSDKLTWEYVEDADKTNLLVHSTESLKPANAGEEVKLHINIPVDGGLGCSICSGPKWRPGIYIQSLKEGGLALEAGLEVGDQVLKVNGADFTRITHSQAIVAFKSSKHLELVIKKGVGIDLFKPRNDPNLAAVESKKQKPPRPPLPRQNALRESKRSKKDSDHTKKEASREIADVPKQEDLIQQAIKVIETKEVKKPRREVNRTSTSEVTIDFTPEMLGQSSYSSDSKRSSRVIAESSETRSSIPVEVIKDSTSKAHTSSKQVSKSQVYLKQSSREKDQSSPIKTAENETKTRLYRKKSETESIYATIGETQNTNKTESKKELRTEYKVQARDDKSETEKEKSTSAMRFSTGFDQPPFPEASTDFRGSPSYETTILSSEPIPESIEHKTDDETSKVKVLNPKIYKPIEIQTFKDQTTIRPSKSPTSYLTEGQRLSTNYRIQKPVLLHPTRKSDLEPAPVQGTSTSAEVHKSLQDTSLFFNEHNFNPSRLFTNEQIAGRQVKLVNIKKEGCTDLGIVIETNLDRVVVAEVYEGGAVHRQGGVHIGDQLMLVDHSSLIGVPVEYAYSVLKEGFRTPRSHMQFVIAKAPPSDFGNEVLPRPDYFDIPISNLDDFMEEDDAELCMYNDDVPVTII